MRLSDFDVLSFDCYGTLIDWDRGILDALAPLTAKLGLSGNDILAAFGEAESDEHKRSPAAPYDTVLRRVHNRLAAKWGRQPADDMAEAFGKSVAGWPAFDDTADALAYLKQHFKLVILSNVSRALFAASQKRLGAEFDAVYTAQDIGSYKPDLRNFSFMIDHIRTELGIPRNKILHVAQSLYHDLAPAKSSGLATAWIDRNRGRPGAARRPDKIPEFDFRFPSLSALADEHRKEMN